MASVLCMDDMPCLYMSQRRGFHHHHKSLISICLLIVECNVYIVFTYIYLVYTPTWSTHVGCGSSLAVTRHGAAPRRDACVLLNWKGSAEIGRKLLALFLDQGLFLYPEFVQTDPYVTLCIVNHGTPSLPC